MYKQLFCQVSILILAFLFSFNNTSAQKVTDIFQKGMTAYNNKHFDEAIQLFKQVLQQEPNNDAALVQIANTYYSIQDDANASLFAEKALSINSKNEIALNISGLLAQKQHQYQKAIDCYQRVIGINPKANFTIAHMAYCYLNLGDNNNAVDYGTRAIEVTKALGFTPQSFMYINRGVAYFKLGKKDKALEDYRLALSVNPDDVDAKKNIALLEAANKNKPMLMYPNINKFSDINDYVSGNLGPYQGKKNITQEDLKLFEQVSRHIDDYSNTSLGPDYYGPAKRAQSNIYYFLGSTLLNSDGFFDNPALMNVALNYFDKSISTENSYNHDAFSPSLQVKTTIESHVDMKTGDYHSTNSYENYNPQPLFLLAYRGKAFIFNTQNKPDSALVSYMKSATMDNDLNRIDDYPIGRLLGAFDDLEKLAVKAHYFDQDYINYCIHFLGKVATKPYPDSKTEIANATIATQLNFLISLAAEAPQDIKYKIELPNLDALARWDYQLMIPPFYALDKAGKISYKGWEAKRYVKAFNQVLEEQQVDDTTRQMLQTLLKNSFAGYMQYNFNDDDDFKKQNLKYVENCKELQWIKTLSEKYPIDATSQKLLDDKMKNCAKWFK